MRSMRLGGVEVLVVDGAAPIVGARALGDVLTAAFEARATTIAIATGRLDPAFFELRSGVAGEIVQRFANYRLRLAVVGKLPGHALASRSFAGFVLEGNRGDGPWFAATLEELGERLTR
jgi:hypothetical protein